MVPWPRRLRVRFGGETVAETGDAILLRQHGFLPVFWLPAIDVRVESLEPSSWTTESPYRGTASYWHLRVGEHVAESAVWTYAEPREGSPDLRGYFSFDFHSMDAWYEEEERIYVHARDPYLRADARRSSRHVVVEVGGVEIADTRRPVLLDETGLITRYYVPLADVRHDLLVPSETFTECPYKGRCDYWSVRTGDGARPGRRLALRAAAARRLRRGRAPVLLAGARGHGAAHRRRDPAAAARRARRRRRRGAARVARPPRDAAAREHARRAGRAAARDRARPNNRAEGPPDGVMDMAASAPAGRPGLAAELGVPLPGARLSQVGGEAVEALVMPSFIPVERAASRAPVETYSTVHVRRVPPSSSARTTVLSVGGQSPPQVSVKTRRSGRETSR